MYEIYANDLLIHSDITPLETHKVSNPHLTLEDSAAGSLEFVLPPNNVGYAQDILKRMVTNIVVKENGEFLWGGRILQDSFDFWNNRKVICEGELAFLNDSIQPPHKYDVTTDHTTIESFFYALIDIHNSQVGPDRQFEKGMVTVTDSDQTTSTNEIYRFTNYETTLACMNDKLLERLKGHLRIRHQAGKRYLDYISDDTLDTNSQVVRFGINLLDFSKNIDMTELSTVIVPRGARLDIDDTDPRYIEGLEPYLTVEGLEDNLDDEGHVTTDPEKIWHVGKTMFVKNPTAVDNFGRIATVVDWDAVTDVNTLYSKAVKYLKDEQYEKMTLEIQALDLKYLVNGDEPIKFQSKLRCVSEPHGMDHTFIVSKMDIDLTNPGNSLYTLGTDVKLSLTQAASRVNSEVQAQIDKIPSKSEILRAAERNAYAMISGAENSYVHFIPATDPTTGKTKGIKRIEVTNGSIYAGDPDAEHPNRDPFPNSTHRWIWSVGGLGHIDREAVQDPWDSKFDPSTGQWDDPTLDVAMTWDGKIVADYITAGHMNCDRLDGGTIKGQHIQAGTFDGESIFELSASTSGEDTTLNWGKTWGDSLTVVINSNRDAGLGVAHRTDRYRKAVYVHYNDVRLYDNDPNPQYAEFDYRSSDVRLKDNIENLDAEKIKKLFLSIRPIHFDYKDGAKNQVGLVAQEFIDVLDDLNIDKEQFITVDDNGFYEIRYNKLYRLAMLAMNDLYNEIKDIKEKLQEEKQNG